MKTYLILHNIRSVHNVGSIFRTADGAGVSQLYLCGFTPAPIDRFGRPCERMVKTALGATESVPWEACADTLSCITALRKEGVRIVAVEQDVRAEDYAAWTQEGNTAYVLGNEIDGVSKDICDAADHILHIPMHGEKESLNVSVTAGIILFNIKKN